MTVRYDNKQEGFIKKEILAMDADIRKRRGKRDRQTDIIKEREKRKREMDERVKQRQSTSE